MVRISNMAKHRHTERYPELTVPKPEVRGVAVRLGCWYGDNKPGDVLVLEDEEARRLLDMGVAQLA